MSLKVTLKGGSGVLYNASQCKNNTPPKYIWKNPTRESVVELDRSDVTLYYDASKAGDYVMFQHAGMWMYVKGGAFFYERTFTSETISKGRLSTPGKYAQRAPRRAPRPRRQRILLSDLESCFVDSRSVANGSQIATREKNACSVYATAALLGKTYDEAHRIMSLQVGRRPRKGAYLRQHLLRFTSVDGVPMEKIDTQNFTVAGFVASKPKGKFYVFTRKHVAVMVDGKYMDINKVLWNQRIEEIWKVKN